MKDLNSLTCLRTDHYQISAGRMDENFTVEWKKMIDSSAMKIVGGQIAAG